MSVFDEITETIARKLGTDQARAVVDAVVRDHAGSTVYVPAQTKSHRAQRNQQIKAERKNGVALTRIVSRYGVSQNTVRRVCR